MANIIITPTMNQFTGMNVGFNQRFYAKNLEKIYIPETDTDIVNAISTVIKEYGRNFSIHSGGHCYENFVYNDTIKAVIDLSTFNQIGKNSQNQYYIESGANNWDVAKTLHHKYGVCLPVGSCYSVGSGGHICGGGYGLLSRLYGLSVDWLSAVDVVCIVNGTAKLIHAAANSSDKNVKNLFWVHTGGGCGNFGVVVRYYFDKLPSAPRNATITLFAIDWADIDNAKFKRIIEAYAAFCKDLNEGVFPEVFILGKFMHKSAKQIVFLIQSVSTNISLHLTKEHEIIINNFELQIQNIVSMTRVSTPIIGHPVSLSAPWSEKVQSLPWIDAVQTLNGSGDNECGKYKSAYMKAVFPPEQIEAMYQALTQDVSASHVAIDMSKSLIQIDSYGGAINQQSTTATAIPQRSSIMKLQYQTYWKNFIENEKYAEERSNAHLKWIRDFYSNVYDSTGGVPKPNEVTDGCYFNYPDVDLGVDDTKIKALELYFKENLPRLVQTKAEWDPDDYFHHGQSIPTKL